MFTRTCGASSTESARSPLERAFCGDVSDVIFVEPRHACVAERDDRAAGFDEVGRRCHEQEQRYRWTVSVRSGSSRFSSSNGGAGTVRTRAPRRRCRRLFDRGGDSLGRVANEIDARRAPADRRRAPPRVHRVCCVARGEEHAVCARSARGVNAEAPGRARDENAPRHLSRVRPELGAFI
jgi:hypothetical protein